MRILFSLLLFLHACLIAAETEFDVVVVGSSPISLLESLHRYYSGQRVLILEEADDCGGAWKSINVCGVQHADLGCHQIGGDPEVWKFLRDHIGCNMVSMSNPHKIYNDQFTHEPHGLYFSQGCYELVHHLKQLIEATDITLLVNNKMECVYVDPARKMVQVKTPQGYFTASKMVVAYGTNICFEHPTLGRIGTNNAKSKYYHLYLLIQDPTNFRFTYRDGAGVGASRMMNLTPFVGLEGTGKQLIVIQTYGEEYLHKGQDFLNDLKKQKLVDPSASILCSESNIYEQSYLNLSEIQKIGPDYQVLFEVIDTTVNSALKGHVARWKKTIPPFGK